MDTAPVVIAMVVDDCVSCSVFLHVADPGQQTLRFSRRGAAGRSMILRAPCSSGDPPQMNFFFFATTCKRGENRRGGHPGSHILILHPPIRHVSLALAFFGA